MKAIANIIQTIVYAEVRVRYILLKILILKLGYAPKKAKSMEDDHQNLK